TNYAPPFSASNPTGKHPSVFDPTQTVPACSDDNRAGMRNQNIYTSRIAPGVVVAARGNSKPLGTIPNQAALLTRMFAVTVQNTTAQERSFRITIVNQPKLANGNPDPSGSASLLQFSLATTEDVTEHHRQYSGDHRTRRNHRFRWSAGNDCSESRSYGALDPRSGDRQSSH